MKNPCAPGRWFCGTGPPVAVVAVIVCVAWASSASATIVIDDFSVGPVDVARPDGDCKTFQVSLLNLDPAHVLGGQRDVYLYFDRGTASKAETRLTIDGGTEQLIWQNTDKTVSTLRLTYAGPGLAGGVDLLESGKPFQNDRIVLEFLNMPEQPRYGDLTLRLTSLGGGEGSVTKDFGGGVKELIFPLSEFYGQSPHALNPTRVTSLTFSLLNDTGSGIVKTDLFDVEVAGGGDQPPIPEPLTVLGMFLGLGSVGAYIRKRRMA